jgi:predicted RNA binding protein YcfA (HicA-like mRNA interferase family)
MTTPGGGSSHAVFRKKGKNPITIPRHRPIKKIYIELVRDVVEEENRHENDR